MRPAIFLDRDGTLIEDRGYLRRPDEAVFFPFTIDALRRLEGRFELFIVTNQGGVGEGLLTLEEADRVNAHVVSVLGEAGVAIREVYCCPHRRADGCACIKPKPHFPERARRDHGIDLSRSYTIGDHPYDVELAANVGATGFFVLTGHGAKHRDQLAPVFEVADDLSAAVDRILARALKVR